MVVLSDDIHWIRAQQQQLVESSCELYTGPVKDRELRDYARADMIISVTEEDSTSMRPYLGNNLHAAECVRHVPIVAKEPPPTRIAYETYRKRSTFLFVGSHHYGNQRAVKWLLDEVRCGFYPLGRARMRNRPAARSYAWLRETREGALCLAARTRLPAGRRAIA
jgi:hypothetical protein